MGIPSAKSCVLCFREIINSEERYLVQDMGKFDVFQFLNHQSISGMNDLNNLRKYQQP